MTPGDRDVLLVVDVQNDFVSGTLAIPQAATIIGPVNAAARAFDHVVIVTDWHPPGHVSFASIHAGAKLGDMIAVNYGQQMVHADHCVQGSWGADLAPDLELAKAELVFRKGYRRSVDSYGAFYENDGVTQTGLDAYLRARGFNRVFCAGLARYACVMQTALGARRGGFAAVMLRDASTGGMNPAANERIIADAGITWMETTEFSTPLS